MFKKYMVISLTVIAAVWAARSGNAAEKIDIPAGQPVTEIFQQAPAAAEAAEIFQGLETAPGSAEDFRKSGPAAGIFQSPETPEIYADCGVILQQPGSDVIVTLQNGHMFSFENEDHDWMIGDLVSIVFENNGTPEITDDTIISYRYSGWISESEQESWIK